MNATTRRRRGFYQNGPNRCESTVILRDGSGCACSRTAVIGNLCRQHAKIAAKATTAPQDAQP